MITFVLIDEKNKKIDSIYCDYLEDALRYFSQKYSDEVMSKCRVITYAKYLGF